MKFEGITEDSVGAFVESFYTKVRRDTALGPVFNAALGGRGDQHITTMRQFWCSALRVKPGYRGDMLEAHRKVARMERSLFPRWLALFEETATECFALDPARILCNRAFRIARNLETALFHIPPRESDLFQIAPRGSEVGATADVSP
jgi:hemoglobin